MRELTEEEIEDIQGKIEWEGFEYYLENYAAEDFEGTAEMELIVRYNDVLHELVEKLRELGLDV